MITITACSYLTLVDPNQQAAKHTYRVNLGARVDGTVEKNKQINWVDGAVENK